MLRRLHSLVTILVIGTTLISPPQATAEELDDPPSTGDRGGSQRPDGASREITATGDQNYSVSAPGELRITGDENRYDIQLPTDVLFDFDEDDLRPDAEPLLRKVKEHFATHETSQVHVWGHTDSKGSDQYNYLLSQRRAKAVCDWLNREVGGFNMCIGRGETEPLMPNENADGSDNALNRQLNRRVTISVVRYPDVNEMLGNAKSEADSALQRLRDHPNSER